MGASKGAALRPCHMPTTRDIRTKCDMAYAGRSHLLPDNLQASIMNVFRLPLNVLVVMGTTVGDLLPTHQVR